MLEREPSRNRPALAPEGADAVADRERPVDQLSLRAGGGVELGRDPGVDLLEQPRRAGEDGRPHCGHRLGDGVGVGAERDREPDVRAEQVHQPPEVVGERKPEEHHVVVGDERIDPVDDRCHLVVVAMPDHAGLGRPGGSGRVDVGERVVLVDGRLGSCQRIRVALAQLPARLLQLLELPERDGSLQPFERPAALDAAALVLAFHERGDRLRVLEQVSALRPAARRVDRGRHGADEAEREVDEAPLERRPADDGDHIALPDAQVEQPERQVVHAAGRFLPGDLMPLAVQLDEIGGVRSRRRSGIAPEASDRASATNGLLRRRWSGGDLGHGQSLSRARGRDGRRRVEANRSG